MTLLVEPNATTMSIDEFIAAPDMGGYELIDGVLTERKPMGALADYVAMQFVQALGPFCHERQIGYVFGPETTYRCFGNPRTGRRADVSFIGKGRLPGEQIPEGYIEIPADVVIEVISPNDLAYNVEEKVALYRQHGFGEVWVAYPNVRSVHVYRGVRDPILFFDASQTLTGRGPLEGFACPVARLFPEPTTT